MTPTSIITLFVASTIKTSIVFAIALGSVALLRRQSAAVRHWVLTTAFVSAALLPVLVLVVPSWGVPMAPPSSQQWIAASSQVDRQSPSAASLADGRLRQTSPPDAVNTVAAHSRVRFVAAVWMGGTGIGLVILLVGFARLTWIASRARVLRDGPWTRAAADIAREYELRRPVILLESDHPALLVTWGCLTPKILLPPGAGTWSAGRVRIVLAHELAHVKRRDWPVQTLAEIVRAIYWFNPLVWMACTHLRQESEHATDDAVLNHGAAGSEYAAHLLDLARALTAHRQAWLPAPAIARPTSLERRVRAMLNDRVNRAPAPRSTRAATVAVVVTLTAALAAAQIAFATFSGTVFDETNGFIPGATLIVTHTQSGAKHEVVTDRTGHFEFVGLPPGDYALETRVPGFANLRGTLTLSGQNAQRDLVLRVASLEETIRVIGGPTRADRTPPSARPAKRPDPVCSAMPAGAMGGNLRAPRKLVDVKPVYPAQLYDAKIGGTVVLQARIDTEGRISTVDVVSPLHPELDAAAMDAVRLWEFDPTILNCTKVEVPMKVTVAFVADK
jgi:TonB family protein